VLQRFQVENWIRAKQELKNPKKRIGSPLINRDVHGYRYNIEKLSIDIDRMAQILRSKEAKDGGKIIRGKVGWNV